MEVLTLDGSVQDIQRLAAFFPDGASVEAVGHFGQRVHFDNGCVVGNATSIGLHFGMQMTVNDFQSRSPMQLMIDHAPTEIEFAFYRGQGTRALCPEGEALAFGGGEFRVGRLHEETRFHWEADAGAVDQSISLQLSTVALKELLGTPQLPEPILRLLTDPSAFALLGQRMDAQMFRTTDEIFELLRDGPSSFSTLGRQLYLQGRALELVGRLCERLLSPVPDSHLPVGDLQRLHRAREVLLTQLVNPPAVPELARLVGLSEGRLKTGFKAIFGEPVMTYARRMRLERARDLLILREKNVTEIAQLVGYTNPSKFSAAYRRLFGISPSTY